MELMRTWYGLSDGEIEEQVNDRLSFSRFADLGMADEIPDSTTLCRFRNALVKSEVYDKLLSEVNRQLSSRHVMVVTGVIVNASVTDSPRRPKGQKEYEAVEDCHEGEAPDTANAGLVEKPRPGVDMEAHWVKIQTCHLKHRGGTSELDAYGRAVAVTNDTSVEHRQN